MDNKILLDSLDGYEFEEVVANIFRKTGYRNVVVQPYSNDGGKDIIMEKRASNDELIKIVVECKHHQSKIGRPVVQKLHSAVITLDYTGKKKGFIVTSSSFSPNAIKYAQEINESKDDIEIQLIDGHALKKRAIDAGVDLKNGIIQAFSNESTYYSSKEETECFTLNNYFENISGINKADFSIQNIKTLFHPTFFMEYNICANFSTTVGCIHSENANGQIIIDGESGNQLNYNLMTSLLNSSGLKEKIISNDEHIIKKDFQLNETELKSIAIQKIIQSHSNEIPYKGKNNVHYTKTCVPKSNDINISYCKSLYYPEWKININAKRNNYNINFIEALGGNIVLKNEANFCKICACDITNKFIFKSKWYCIECGAITCKGHIKITRMTKINVCDNCATVKKFFGARKYFESVECLEDFEEYYSSMPLYKKTMENKYLLYSLFVSSIIFYLAYVY